MKVLAEKLKSNNLKVTPQRIAIYSYLTNTCTHPSVETIYNDLKADYPTMSLATVYKTVASLRDAHLIQEINVGEDSFRYDGCPDIHSHLICRKCHKIYDYKKPVDFDILNEDIHQSLGFTPDSHQLYIYGVCKDCE